MLPLKIKGLEKPPINNNNENFFKEKFNKEDYIIPTVFFFFFGILPTSIDYCIDKYDSRTIIQQGNLSKFKTPELQGKVLNRKETEKKIKWLIGWMKKDNISWFIKDVDKKIKYLKRQNEIIDPIILDNLNNLKMAQIENLAIEKLPTIFGRRHIFILPFDSRYNPSQSTKDIKLPRKLKKQFSSSRSDSYHKNLWEGDLNIFLEKWLNKKNNHDILSKLKIENINNLTPYQAVKLTIEIVNKELTYSYIQASSLKETSFFMSDYSLKKKYIDKIPENIKKKPKLAYEIKNKIDGHTIADLLRNGKGVCRNYARAIEDIFNLLKRSQNQKTNQLKNTYVRYADDHRTDNDILNQVTENHAWINVFSVLPTGDVVISNIDIVNGDMGEVYAKNCTTKGYYLFFLHTLQKEKIISKEQFEQAVKNFEEKIKPEFQFY